MGMKGKKTNKAVMHEEKKESTVRTRIIGLCARALELPLLVRSGVFSFFVSESLFF